MPRGLSLLSVLGLAVAAAGCERMPAPASARTADALDWEPPPEDSIPDDSLGASIRRGLALLRFTPESLPAYAPSSLRCTSCHQMDGRKATAAPLVGSHARFPKYLARTGAVVTLADRVNYCITRSLAGNTLPPQSREMSDFLAYFAFLARGAPVGALLPGDDGLRAMPEGLTGDTARGRVVYETTCAVCHGKDGGGAPPAIPALWGPKSYSIGASMARESRAASFIWHNMPQNTPGTLTPQQAFDVAAFVNSHPRPDSPGKELDWPGGDAPRDTPYATKAHQAYRPPAALLRRRSPALAVVPVPARASRAVAGRQSP